MTTKENISAPKVIIKKPRVTEKAAMASEKNVYVFEVTKDANKSEIKKEVERIYGTKVDKVNIAKLADKPKIIRGRKSKKTGIKKAYVYLKEGEKSLEIF